MNMGLPELILMLFSFVIVPAAIIYFTVKAAVKKAIKELKEENRL